MSDPIYLIPVENLGCARVKLMTVTDSIAILSRF